MHEGAIEHKEEDCDREKEDRPEEEPKPRPLVVDLSDLLVRNELRMATEQNEPDGEKDEDPEDQPKFRIRVSNSKCFSLHRLLFRSQRYPIEQ
jgi:hypothetical protein